MVGKGGGEVLSEMSITMKIPEKHRWREWRIVVRGASRTCATWMSAAPYRGRVKATEYLGTTQIVTLETANGDLKARVASSDQVTVGDQTGLTFDPRTITLFDVETGAALRVASQRRGADPWLK